MRNSFSRFENPAAGSDGVLARSIWKVTYPTNPNRTTYAKDIANGLNYATDAKYALSGSLCSLKNGASITSTFTFTNRLQPNRVHVTSNTPLWNPCDAPTQNANILDFTYSFNAGTANNGNVAQIANSITPDRTQNFTYDELNRIKTAATQATSGTYAWGLSFGYDIWANLLTASVTQGNPPMLNVGVNTKNQINTSGFVYDAAGNITSIPNPAGLTAEYDAENRMTRAVGGGAAKYAYDGDGKRLWKGTDATPPVPYKLYWYGVSADPLLESDGAGAVSDEYIFFGGKRIARRQSSGTIHYYFADHLGSSRVVTSTAGAILEDSDYYPFGGERIVLDTVPDQNYKFTGKERDTESNLDFFIARYYSSGYGRFLSPDEFTGGPVDVFSSGDPLPPGPLAYSDITNPQAMNKYTYALNNPLHYIDPTGHANEEFGYIHCWAGQPVCEENDKKNKSAGISDEEIDKGIAKALANELISIQNFGNRAAAQIAGTQPPAEVPLLKSSSPGEQTVMNLVSALLLMGAFSGKQKAARKVGEEALERHHWLVQQFRKWFDGPGRKIDIEKFTEGIQRKLHRGAGDSLHGRNFNLNRMWAEFVRRHPAATRNQVRREYRRLKARWRDFVAKGGMN